MTFDWQSLLVAIAILGAIAYLVSTHWPTSAGDDASGSCGSCSSGCDAERSDPETKPQVKSIVPVEDLLKKRVG